jgi:hypothetical protein
MATNRSDEVEAMESQSESTLGPEETVAVLLRVSQLAMVLWATLCMGCAHLNDPIRPEAKLRELLSDVRYLPHSDVEWIVRELSKHEGDRLIGVYTEMWRENVYVWERRLEQEVLVCDEYAREGDQLVVRRVYEIDRAEAIAMFRNLFRQAAAGEKYVDREYLETVLDHSCEYLITTGSRWALTVNEGGSYDFYMYLCEWEADPYREEIPKNIGSWAVRSFGPDELASTATLVVGAVHYFDTMCEVAYRWTRQQESG